MTRFRPCIDLHNGRVKQIVGGSLRDDEGKGPITNFISDHDAAWFANLYRNDGLSGAHVIQLGPGNTDAAKSAVSAWPDGLQIGGGIRLDNARDWLEAGARQLIVTSWLFDEQHQFQHSRLEALAGHIGSDRLVVDLSCRKCGNSWRVAMNRWQSPTDLVIDAETLNQIAPYCSEFLIHAADVEGLRGGMDENLIRLLGEISPLPVTYAGGASAFEDLEKTNILSHGRVDLTIGSALDIFGGTVSYRDCVSWNQQPGRSE